MESSSFRSDSYREHENGNEGYKATISKLPRRSLLVADNSFHAYQYQGFWLIPQFLEGVMSAQDHFRAQPTDIVLANSPKTGTTWLKAIMFAIATRNKFDLKSNNPLQTTSPQACIPFLELDLAAPNQSNQCRELPVLATHIPYTSLPESIVASGSGCKIVYIWRDPNDTFVSLWHFITKVLPKETEFLPLEEAFEQFCNGFSNYGPYWEHILGYWRASLERPGKILFLKYEDLKKNTLCNVKKLAKFMGYPFSMEEEKEGVVEKLIQLCSFEYLSNLEVNKSGNARPDGPLSIDNDAYFRKGKVGDWKNHLTAKMKDQLDQIMEQKLRGSGLTMED